MRMLVEIKAKALLGLGRLQLAGDWVQDSRLSPQI